MNTRLQMWEIMNFSAVQVSPPPRAWSACLFRPRFQPVSPPRPHLDRDWKKWTRHCHQWWCCSPRLKGDPTISDSDNRKGQLIKKTFKKWWNFIDSTYIKAGHIFRVSNKKIITPASNHYHGDKEIRWPVVPSFSDCKVHFMLGEHDSQTHRKPFLRSVQCFLPLL